MVDHHIKSFKIAFDANGNGWVAGGTGVLLNDEMDDFSIKPGNANVYGLIGNSANAIAPGKRMLSSMSPTFVESAERLVILGTPGGSRIITMVLNGILAAIDGAGAEALVSAPRFHHQYLPDRIDAESGMFDASQRAFGRPGFASTGSRCAIDIVSPCL
mgnify:CR=1 FL=1